MFGFPRRRRETLSPSRLDGELRDFENRVVNTVKIAWEDDDVALLSLTAGAVFALREDTLRRLDFDLANATRSFAAHVSEDKETTILERITATLQKLVEENENFALQVSPEDLQRDDHKVNYVGAIARSVAGNVWLVTVLSQVSKDRPHTKLAAANIWLMLAHVDGNEVAETARMMTGSFYAGTRSDQFDPAAWPLCRYH